MQKSQKSILIVDDDKANSDLLVHILQTQYELLLATTGHEALTLSQERAPDMILLDVMLPDIDGFDVCQQLKENPRTCNIPIIFVTAMDQREEESRGLNLGAVDYVNKPINATILQARVRTHLALADQGRLLEEVKERTLELEKTQEALRESMGNLLTIQVGPGVYWMQIPEAGLFILCGCPSEVVKLLMLKGLNSAAIKNGVKFETGPNVILLSDVLVQNGGFANMAEFPVLQMLYRQGMIIPGHPNNTGIKPMLIGSADQVQAQMAYIHRGNYGLSREEILATGVDEATTDNMMRIKLQFAFGQIREPSQFLDTLILDDTPREIRNGAMIHRIGCNQFRFTFRNKTADVDLNLPRNVVYKSPYPLDFHQMKRHYFAVLHTGEGDGWDARRPSMSSILMFQGRIYLIDAIPGILNVLTALGIDISEVEGIFQTHAHDDHFAGLPALIQTDRRLKYYSTALVRSSVAKKFAALMSIDEEKFHQFFEIHDLEFNTWNYCGGLEIKPFYAPHPVENNLLLFRALDHDGYRSYAHWTDLASMDVLDKMTAEGPLAVPVEFIEEIKQNYLLSANLKKLDIGGGMIHGVAQDFRHDPSAHLILAHSSREMSIEEMEIGSEATFGAIDVLIPGEQDYRRQRSFYYLRELFPDISDDAIRMLINGSIIHYNAGTFIRRESESKEFVEMTISGDVVFLDADFGIRYHLGFGAFMGLQSIFTTGPLEEEGSYRAISHTETLKISVPLLKIFLDNSGLFSDMANVLEKIRFLRHTWLFGEQTSFVFLAKIARAMEYITIEQGTWIQEQPGQPTLWMVNKGRISLFLDADELKEEIEFGGFFGEQTYLYNRVGPCRFQASTPCELLRLQWDGLMDAPIVHWKMLEISQKRQRPVV